MNRAFLTRIRILMQGRVGRFLAAQLAHTAITLVILSALFLGARQVGALSGILDSSVQGGGHPTTINYQGRLADPAGNPIDNTSPGIGMTFALYNTDSGGGPLWAETHANVPVSDGLFSVRLGSIRALSTDILNGDRWLGIQVGTDPEMTPREKLSSVPYALMALTVPDGSITASKAPFAVQHYVGTRLQQFPKVSTGTYGATLTGGSSVQHVDLDISALGFTRTPIGIAQLVDGGTPAVLARYTWDGSTATRAQVMFFRPDGQNIAPGRCRYHLILWSD